MLEYFAKAFSVWFTGFFPFFEIYVAIPYGFVLGLDPYSIVFWAVLGNFLPVPLIEFGYSKLEQWAYFRRWQTKLISPKLERQVAKNGIWFIPVFTPWIGVWAVAVTCKIMKVKARILLLTTFIGIAVYAIGLTILIETGISIFTTD